MSTEEKSPDLSAKGLLASDPKLKGKNSSEYGKLASDKSLAKAKVHLLHRGDIIYRNALCSSECTLHHAHETCVPFPNLFRLFVPRLPLRAKNTPSRLLPTKLLL